MRIVASLPPDNKVVDKKKIRGVWIDLRRGIPPTRGKKIPAIPGYSVEVFLEAIAITPESGWPYIGLASSYTILGNWEGAISALNNADKYSYDDPSLLLSIGWGYVDLGDCTTAMEYFERILTMDPYDEGAQEGMDFCSS